MLKVYHGRNFINMTAGHAKWPDDYKLVATVDTKDPEKAFALTNHIDSDWTLNEGITPEPGKHRSSSVGDVVVFEDGSALKCAFAGWTSVNAGDS